MVYVINIYIFNNVNILVLNRISQAKYSDIPLDGAAAKDLFLLELKCV